MMWRVLAVLDFVTIAEIHFGMLPWVPAFGVSMGTHVALGAFAWKIDMKCLLGPIPINAPPTLSHDAGVMRPHVMIDLSPLPPPPLPPATPANSAITSAMATLFSVMKPTFSSSRDLRAGNPAGPGLPVSTEALPFGAGIVLSGNVPCGIGGPHMGIPMIPTQLTDWSGLTFGDMVGGVANMFLETLSQAALEVICVALPGRWDDALLAVLGYGSPFGISIWPSGHQGSQPIQQAIDRALSGSSGSSSSSTGSGSGSSSSGTSSGSSSGSSGKSGGTSPAPGIPGWEPFGGVA